MVKPLDFDALAARLDHWLNRDVGQIRLGNLVYDPATRHLECRRKILLLPARERDLADLLFRRVGQTVPRAMVEHQLYGVGSDHGSNVVDVLIHRLRRRLIQAEAGVMIRTLRGAGLTMAPADQITCDKPR
jgi:DNA-binding response OmpR family regulator